MDTTTRALVSSIALTEAWHRRGRDLRQIRGDLVLVITEQPRLFSNKEGVLGGIEFRVKLFHNNEEIPIDSHRRFWRPLLYVDNGPPDFPLGIEQLFPELWGRKRRLDPVAAAWNMLWDVVLTHPAQENWGDPRGTTTTVFASDTDGFVSSTNATYTTARSGSGLAANTTSDLRIGQSRPKDYLVEEGFLSFDTSAIDDADTVSAVTLSLWLTTDSSTTNFVTQARESNWGAGLTTADWVAGASLSGLTLMASIDSNGIGATGAYKDFTSEAAFLSATGLKTGTVYLVLCSAEQTNNSAPTGNEFCIWESADTAGTTNDPKLTIIHTGSSITATAAMTLPKLAMSASGGQTFTGIIAATLAKLGMSAAGTQVHTGIVTATLPKLALSALGAQAHTGTAAATLPKLAMTATGIMHPAGTVAATLKPLAMSASGTMAAVIGTAAISLPRLTSSATGTMHPSGTAAISLRPLTMSAVGTQIYTGAATFTLTKLAFSGTGVMQPSGTASVTLQPLTLSASGLFITNIPGTAALTLPALTFAGIATFTIPASFAIEVTLNLPRLAKVLEIPRYAGELAFPDYSKPIPLELEEW